MSYRTRLTGMPSITPTAGAASVAAGAEGSAAAAALQRGGCVVLVACLMTALKDDPKTHDLCWQSLQCRGDVTVCGTVAGGFYVLGSLNQVVARYGRRSASRRR